MSVLHRNGECDTAKKTVTTDIGSSLSQRFSQLINFRIYRRLTIKVMSDEKKLIIA